MLALRLKCPRSKTKKIKFYSGQAERISIFARLTHGMGQGARPLHFFLLLFLDGKKKNDDAFFLCHFFFIVKEKVAWKVDKRIFE